MRNDLCEPAVEAGVNWALDVQKNAGKVVLSNVVHNHSLIRVLKQGKYARDGVMRLNDRVELQRNPRRLERFHE